MARRTSTDTRTRRGRRLAAVGIAALTALAGLAATAGSSAATSPASSQASRPGPHAPYVAGQLLVRFGAGTSPAAAAGINERLGATTLKSFSYLVPNLQLVQLRPGVSVSSAELSYSRQAGVEYAQPNWIFRIAGAKAVSRAKTPDDPRYSEQWAWPKIDAPQAWARTTGSRKVVVTDIDTGMDYNHEDLAANAWQNKAECKGKKGVDDDHNGYVDDCHGIDTINGDSDPMDDNGHGTHTAGTIGAVGNNKTGVTGFNWNVQVMPCKSHSDAGVGTVASIVECYQYVKTEKVKYGYDIVATNNSYGGCTEACDFDPATYDAIAALIKPGVIMAFAAGNSARDNDVQPNYPSNYDLPNILAVAATDSTDAMSSFSEWGVRSVDVGAPGSGVLSTLPNNSYGSLSGTSMATPHVAGLAALLASWKPELDWTAIRNLILTGGDKVDSLKGKTVTGRRIDAEGSMRCSKQKVFGMLSPVANTGSRKQAVEAVNVDCAKPAGAVSLTIAPGHTKLRLSDDGRGADLVKDDGIYAAWWKAPCGASDVTFTFSNGRSYDVDVAACVKLEPASGRAGSSTKVTGKGYTPSEVVDVFFDDSLVDTVNADSKGRVSDNVRIPKTSHKGRHLVTVSGQTSGVAAAATFRVR